MGNPMEDRIAQSMAQFEERRAQIMDLQREFQTASVTVTAKDRSVEVTVDAQGNVTGLRFPNSKYRSLPPAELAAVLMQTMGEARTQVRQQVLEAFQPLSGRKLGDGRALDWESLFGPLKEEGIATPPVRPPSSGASARSGLADEITEDDDKDSR
ncbi:MULTISPECIES: YbaB/EbfC family nucleoid-associated protein [unclassified Streptomyces]|uniref:YbaB/EbfC family nucleoid-associated protein n=1 Tax=unclassified Streptomyces TaxID=2593676 RepID=UPI003412E88A